MFRIPNGLQQLIPPAAANKMMELLHQPALANAVREAAQKLGWQDLNAPGQIQDFWQQTKQWFESTLGSHSDPAASAVASLNGTGQLFMSAMGGIPLPAAAADRAARMLGYINSTVIEQQCLQMLKELSRAEDALLVPSVEHAIRLLGHMPQACDGWLVRRSDFVSWSEHDHLGNCLEATTAKIISIGSISHCSETDFTNALRGNCLGMLHLSPNRLPKSTSGDAAQSHDLRKLKTKTPVIHVDVLFDGCFHDAGIGEFPHTNIAERLATGTSVIIVPGDRLLGGPACGIVLGNRDLVAALRAEAIRQKLLLHPLVTGCLDFVLTQQKSPESWLRLPIPAMLTNSVANLHDRGRRLAFQIRGGHEVESVEIIETSTPIGDYLWSEHTLPSVALKIKLRDVDQWTSRIRSENQLTLMASREGNVLTIHLRSIDPADDRLLADLFPAAMETSAPQTATAPSAATA